MKEHVSKNPGQISIEEIQKKVLLGTSHILKGSSINSLRNDCTLKPKDNSLVLAFTQTTQKLKTYAIIIISIIGIFIQEFTLQPVMLLSTCVLVKLKGKKRKGPNLTENIF